MWWQSLPHKRMHAVKAAQPTRRPAESIGSDLHKRESQLSARGRPRVRTTYRFTLAVTPAYFANTRRAPSLSSTVSAVESASANAPSVAMTVA